MSLHAGKCSEANPSFFESVTRTVRDPIEFCIYPYNDDRFFPVIAPLSNEVLSTCRAGEFSRHKNVTLALQGTV